MNEAVHTISLISQSKSWKSSSSLIRATVIQHPSFYSAVNERETRFASGMERDLSDLSRSIRHQEIFEPQPGNFGWMDCAPGVRRKGTTSILECLQRRAGRIVLNTAHDYDTTKKNKIVIDRVKLESTKRAFFIRGLIFLMIVYKFSFSLLSFYMHAFDFLFYFILFYFILRRTHVDSSFL